MGPNRRLRSAALGAVRRGPRTVLWTSEQLGFGNLLYEWMQADLRSRDGRQTLALVTDKARPWLPLLPSVADTLLIERDRVGLSDRRELGEHQGLNRDFTMADIERFGSDYLLDAPLLTESVPTRVPEDAVVLNVRRGDYYSEPRWRALYAFNIVGYVEAAMSTQVRQGGQVPRVHVVSDDVHWCREHLGPVLAGVPEVTYVSEHERPADHFATLVAARRLILTNSTFSYWGAYLSTLSRGDNYALVVAPWFHARASFGHGAYQLDPRWSVVADVPGGWDPVGDDAV